MNNEITISPENAGKFQAWLQSRGGIAVWKSINLANASGQWFTPALAEDGKPYTKPNWQCANEPEIITSDENIFVSKDEEFKTIRIALRQSGNGLSIKLTDASSRKLRKELDKAGEGSRYEFGGWDGKDCIIFKQAGKTQLPIYIQRLERQVPA